METSFLWSGGRVGGTLSHYSGEREKRVLGKKRVFLT